MDNYDYILSRNNTVLTANIFSTITELIQNKLNSPSNASKKDIAELKYLKEKIICADPLICTTASSGLIYLVKCGTLQMANTILELVALGSLTQNYRGIIMAITELLILDLRIKLENESYVCPFNLVKPQHPLISILLQDSSVWIDILNYVMKSYENEDITLHLNELFRPLFLYILCDPLLKAPQLSRIKFMSIILEKCDVYFVTEFIAWLQITSNENELHTVNVLSHLIETNYVNDNYDLQEFLLLWLTSTLYELCAKKWNPTEIIMCLTKLINRVEFRSTSSVLNILANCLYIVSPINLKDLLNLIKMLILKNISNLYALQSIKAALLNWMLHPSIFIENSARIIDEIFTSIENTKISERNTTLLQKNKYICLYQSTNEHVHLAIETSLLLESCSTSEKIFRWLNTLDNVSSSFFKNLFSTLCGIFLRECDVTVTLKALNLLVTFSQINKYILSNILALILYKLANTMNRHLHFYLLKALPMIGIKENLHLIIGTLQALYKSTSHMKPVVISLFYDLWEYEIKCFPYLQNLMIENNQNVEFNITKANILKKICDKRPELYGSEMAGHLSKILNLSKSEDESGLSAALALEGLKCLCIGGEIDIETVWKTLAKRFHSETRIIVIKSFCDLLSEVPNLHTENAKYEKMVLEVVDTLWNYIILSSDEQVINAACKALGSFSLEQISSRFPDIYQIPTQSEEIGSNVNLISGKCWINVLQNINYNALSPIANLLITLVLKEVNEYLRGIYVMPRNTREPINYNYLPAHSIVRALINHIKNNIHKYNNEIDVVYLKIISHEYSKPLPPLDWCFLQELVHIPQFRSYCICLASHQVVLSGTARRLMENLLQALTETINYVDDIICIMRNFKYLCNSIQPMIIKPFITTSYHYAVKMVKDNNDYSLLDEMILHINEMLKMSDVQETNKNILVQLIIDNLKSEAITTDIFKKLLQCVLGLPLKNVKELSSKVWYETSPDNFRKTVMIRSILAKENANLIWFNEIIDVAGFLKDEQCYVLEAMFNVLVEIDNNKTYSTWILELLGQIQVNLADTNNFNEDIKFMCGVLIISIVTLSGYHSLLANNLIDMERFINLFPQSLAFLMRNEHWNDCVSQILEWLYHMINFKGTPENYKKTFLKSLMAMKHETVFKESLKWLKYMGCKPLYK